MMTTGQAASYLDVSTCTLREWVKKGYIPVVMKTPTGYLKFAEENVEAFRKKMEQDGDILTTGK